MALLSSLSGGNEGNAQGLQARQKALRDIGAGALSNSPKASSTSTAAKPKPTPSGSAPNPSPTNRYNPGGAKYGDKPGEKRLKLGPSGEVLGSFHKGGKVKKTGVYRLKNKERVLSPKQTAKFEKKGGLAAMLGGK